MKNPFSASMSGFRPLTWNEGVRSVVRWNGGANPGEAERVGQAMADPQWAHLSSSEGIPGFGDTPTADPVHGHPIVSWYFPTGHPGSGWVVHTLDAVGWYDGEGNHHYTPTPQDGMGATSFGFDGASPSHGGD